MCGGSSLHFRMKSSGYLNNFISISGKFFFAESPNVPNIQWKHVGSSFQKIVYKITQIYLYFFSYFDHHLNIIIIGGLLSSKIDTHNPSLKSSAYLKIYLFSVRGKLRGAL